MIDFCKYETMKLGDIAEWERAKKGFVYPAGCTIIQVSATKGEVHYLTKKSEVEPKYVVVFLFTLDMFKHFNNSKLSIITM